jgi:hypothetical protein
MAASIHPYGALAGASILLMTATVWASRIQPAQPPAPQLTTREVELFESRVRPLLIDNCFSCHTDDEKGGLRLDSRDRM